ncbi:MAG: hypothetical protein QXI42_11120 [Thermoproteota archaeon]
MKKVLIRETFSLAICRKAIAIHATATEYDMRNISCGQGTLSNVDSSGGDMQ